MATMSPGCGSLRWSAAVAALVIAGLGSGCDASEQRDRPLVHFGSAPRVGTWDVDAAGSDGSPAGEPLTPPGSAAAGTAALGGAGGAVGSEPGWQNGDSAGVGAAGAGANGGESGSGGQDGAAVAGTGASTEPGVGAAVTSLEFEVLTVRQGGKYAPKNIGAIWIADAAGEFVKTLEVWAGTRRRYLYRFNAETRGNTVDAVTGATLRSHVLHQVSWDLTDANGDAVPPGAYKVVVEVTDHESQGETTEIDFVHGEPSMLMPPDQTYYKTMRLSLQ